MAEEGEDGAPEEEAREVEVFRGRGRPTKYKPEYVGRAKELCAAGATDADLAIHFEVAISTIYAWKSAFSEFSEAIKSEKSEADDRVEHSLYRRAVGYSQHAVRIFLPKGAPAPVYAEYVEAVAPDVTAAIFWLKNRRPEQWRDRINHELTGKNGGPVEVKTLADFYADLTPDAEPGSS